MAPMVVVAVMMAVTAAVGAAGAMSQARNEKKMFEYNARVKEADGLAARQSAEFEEMQHRLNFDRFRGEQTVSLFAGGGTMEGSPLLAMEENAANAELDAMAIRRSGTIAESRAKSEAALNRMQGAAAMQAGSYQAVGTLLGGLAKAGSAMGGGGMTAGA